MLSNLIDAYPTTYEKQIQLEVFDHLRDILDPDFQYSLEDLKVITEDAIEVDEQRSLIKVTLNPTVECASSVSVIGLCVRVKLMRSALLPSHYKLEIKLASGNHETNKELNDKDIVASALENHDLLKMVDECLTPC